MPPSEKEATNDKKATLWASKPEDFVRVLGEDLVAAFCQALIHADRLTVLFDLLECSFDRHGTETVAHQNALHTVPWMICGILWEARLAITALKSAGHSTRCAEARGEQGASVARGDGRRDPSE